MFHKIILAFGLWFMGQGLVSQSIEVISQPRGLDSSYYHLLQVDDNEYWAGGKNGVLTSLDTMGNMTPIVYPSFGLKILKIVQNESYIYFSTDNAVIYRYDKSSKTFSFRKFDNFENRAFYDMILLDTGELIVVGGSSSIVQSKKKFPMGFIGIVSSDLDSIEIVWKKYRKFVWSVVQDASGNIIAATFNGLNTKLIESTDKGRQWKKKKKVRGLVHEVAVLEDELWYCGASGFYFFDYFWKNGILGEVDGKRYKLKEKSCQWSLCRMGKKIATINTRGEIILTDLSSKETQTVSMPYPAALYDIEEVSEGKFLVVGKGKGAYLINFD